MFQQMIHRKPLSEYFRELAYITVDLMHNARKDLGDTNGDY